jgi:hypothetical protein
VCSNKNPVDAIALVEVKLKRQWFISYKKLNCKVQGIYYCADDFVPFEEALISSFSFNGRAATR